jgi:hypothetical protein
MRFFYMTDKWTWDAKLFLDGKPFHMGIIFKSAHFIQLGDGTDEHRHILLSGELKSDDWGKHWHSHPLVARLPHPHLEATVPINHLTKDEWRHKNFQGHHFGSLEKHLGITEGHTVWDLHEIARKIHPEVRLDYRY